MIGHVEVTDLAGRLAVPVATIEAMAAAADFRIIDRGGRRWLRLKDAGRIVRLIDPVDPRWDRRGRGGAWHAGDSRYA